MGRIYTAYSNVRASGNHVHGNLNFNGPCIYSYRLYVYIHVFDFLQLFPKIMLYIQDGTAEYKYKNGYII
jgi:hypothetical protein